MDHSSAAGSRAATISLDSRAQAAVLAADLKEALGLDKVLIMDLVPAIVTHAGPGALAVGFFAVP